MSKLQNELQNVVSTADMAEVDLDVLADLVESELSNVVGGGFRQWSCCHKRTRESEEEVQA